MIDSPAGQAGPTTLRGVVHRTFHSSPGFSAGLLRTDDGDFVRFRGRFCAAESDLVALVGRWMKDRKYGRQFDVQRLSYDLPESPEGLMQYLAGHPAFKGVGIKTAERLVRYAGDAASLDRLLREDVYELHERLRVPLSTLTTLRHAWIANADQNEVRSFLASFGLTPHQMDVLLETYGNSAVGVLRTNPYLLIKHLDGYGFKRVDKIARRMGIAKEHVGRIEAGIVYCVSQEIAAGHTWVGAPELVEQANEVLMLDGLDSRDRIIGSIEALIEAGELAAEDQDGRRAISFPRMLEAERHVHDVLHAHAWREWVIPGNDDPRFNPRQREAYGNALTHRISVITGGAGTGKTFVVARLAAACMEAGLPVALCAPTGKAAKRIEELVRPHGLDLEAKTIHRLLEYNGHVFNRRDLSEPILGLDESGHEVERSPGYQVIIVDEVSMVDVLLLAELFERIDFDKTSVVLVGDHNQLPPVGPGNVLRDIIHHNLAPTTILTDVVRQAGVLKANSSKILSGVIAPTAVNDPGWAVIDCFREGIQIQTYLRDLVLRLIPEQLGFDPVHDVQVVTPTHKGPLGTKTLNDMMQFLVHGKVEDRFAIGDKVIQTANDYDMGVMNGTIGYVAEREDGEYFVDFEGVGLRKLGGERLSNVQLAYALTAHKAQGSEFPCVVVVCHKSHFFADRNWLYTAVTRASKTCIILGDRWGLRRAVSKNHTIGRRTFLSRWAVAAREAQ